MIFLLFWYAVKRLKKNSAEIVRTNSDFSSDPIGRQDAENLSTWARDMIRQCFLACVGKDQI